MADTESAPADQVAERVFGASLGMIETLAIHIGDRLGYFRALADHGPLTSAGLANATGTSERYAREWLELQATLDYLQVSGRGPGAEYAIGAGAAEVFTDEASTNYLAPLARMLAAPAARMPALLDAYRTGGGVSWDEFGDDARQSQAAMNRPWFEHRLAGAIAQDAALHAALSAPGARIVDVGCGAGWSTIALAAAFPESRLLGVDVDAPSIEAAVANAAARDLGARVSFRTVSGDEVAASGPFDVAFIFEALHDMPQPVEVLAAIRASLAPGGFLVVMDEAVADELTPGGDEVERVMYGFSLLICLPDGLSTQPSVGTGTVMRPATLRRYAEQAGFTSVEVLPIEGFAFFRFYRLGQGVVG